jgi:hypothetical protein
VTNLVSNRTGNKIQEFKRLQVLPPPEYIRQSGVSEREGLSGDTTFVYIAPTGNVLDQRM